MGWEISIGFYTGILVGIYSARFEDGMAHYLYFPFFFIVLDIYR